MEIAVPADGLSMSTASFAARAGEVSYLLADLATEVATYAQSLEADPLRLSVVQERRAQLAALVRECLEELGVAVEAGDFLGEVPLDGVVGGGPRGASTMRLWAARVVSGELVAHEHAALRWVTAEELDDVDWIAADRPLIPAVRTLLTRP